MNPRRAVLSARAEIELATIFVYYESKLPGLGKRFVRAVDHRSDLILATPYAFARWKRSTRLANVPRFPYGILYIARPRFIDIVAIIPTRSNPKNWLS